jgi:hypothetical protein
MIPVQLSTGAPNAWLVKNPDEYVIVKDSQIQYNLNPISIASKSIGSKPDKAFCEFTLDKYKTIV